MSGATSVRARIGEVRGRRVRALPCQASHRPHAIRAKHDSRPWSDTVARTLAGRVAPPVARPWRPSGNQDGGTSAVFRHGHDTSHPFTEARRLASHEATLEARRTFSSAGVEFEEAAGRMPLGFPRAGVARTGVAQLGRAQGDPGRLDASRLACLSLMRSTTPGGDMRRNLILALTAFVLGGCADDGLYDVPFTAPVTCGQNSSPIGSTCYCDDGYEWSDYDDPDNLNCRLAAGPAEPTGEIIVEYGGADDAYHQTIEAFLMERGLHEWVAQAFTQALRLPEDLYLASGECGMLNAFFLRTDDGRAAIVMCYELYASITSTFQSVFDDDQSASYAYDTWMFVLFHEMGHALVELLGLNVVTAEEDVVDAFAAIMLVGLERPDGAINAANYWFLADDQQTLPQEFADEHSLSSQRFYNILCLVYGSDPATYDWMATQLPEMESRLARCEDEWVTASENWDELLQPHER